MTSTNRIAINTISLYIKLLLSIITGFFTTRLVLNALGEINFGIYAVVGSTISMISILNSALTISTMRYLGFSLGKGDKEESRTVFNTTFIIHLTIGCLVVILAEILGTFIFDGILNIPIDRIVSAKILMHFVILSVFINIINVPYEGVINAHDDIFLLSIIDLIKVFFNLIIAIYLPHSNYDVLITYGVLVCLNELLASLFKQFYSIKKYDECSFKNINKINKSLLRNIGSFIGWSTLGAFASMCVTQGRAFILNVFFGVKVNTANGIANSVNMYVNSLAVNMTRAFNPSINKSEGEGSREKLIRLTYVSSKFSLYLFILLAIPIFIETPFLIKVWLNMVPEFTIIFIRLLILSILVEKLTAEISTAIIATGNIRKFQLFGSILRFLNILIGYWLFSLGFKPYSIFVVMIFIGLLMGLLRLIIGKSQVGINPLDFLKKSIFPTIPILILTVILSITPQFILNEGIIRATLTFFISTVSLIVFIRYFGLRKEELTKIIEIFQAFGNKTISIIKNSK